MRDLFPYTFREGQKELVEFIHREAPGGEVCVNAATGFGKTPVILAALLPYTLEDEAKVIWAVRTGTETDRPIEELKEICRKKRIKLFGLSYRGKRDMCLLARETGRELDYQDVSFLCRVKGDKCKYRQNLEDFDTSGLAKGPLLYSEILEACREFEICPYFTQRALLPHADVVSLSYNYIIDAKMAWSIRRAVPFEDSFLVVDEAHNLQHACSNLFSDRITLGTAERAVNEAKELESKRASNVGKLAKRIKEKLSGSLESVGREEEEFDASDFFISLAGSKRRLQALAEELKIMRECGMVVRRRLLEQGKTPRSSLFHLADFCLASLDYLGTRGIAFLVRREKKNLILERQDMRAAEVLAERWNKFVGCVFCSGTLTPVKAFAETVGLELPSSKCIRSSFPQENLLSLITRGLTTKGEVLSKQMAKRYLKAIASFAKALKTNVAVFSASYRIQRGLLGIGLEETARELGMKFFLEVEGMSGDESRKVLDGFKACAQSKEPGFLCATATGRFAEGADFPGRELQGIFLVGIPFERITVRTKLYIDYYKELYGREKGTYYAYVVPALRRACQALGRALRSEEDKGAFVCGDERYAEKRFFRLLPDFIQAGARVVGPREAERELSSWGRKNLRRPMR
jgi:DNA excision repair protein ERCC-2